MTECMQIYVYLFHSEEGGKMAVWSANDFSVYHQAQMRHY